MKRYENKPIQKVERTLVEIVCDTCKAQIKPKSTYYEVTLSHSDWGNYSIESIENKHICSDECLQKEFNEYLEFESDTKEIEIQKETYVN